MERGRRGLQQGRMVLAFAIVTVALAVGYFVFAAPGVGWFGPARIQVLGLEVDANVAMLAIGILGPIIGLTWMWRLHRSYREPEVHPWRYRDLD